MHAKGKRTILSSKILGNFLSSLTTTIDVNPFSLAWVPMQPLGYYFNESLNNLDRTNSNFIVLLFCVNQAKVFIATNRVDPNLWLGQQRETALHVAAENGHSEFCEFLLEIGADKDQKGASISI